MTELTRLAIHMAVTLTQRFSAQIRGWIRILNFERKIKGAGIRPEGGRAISWGQANPKSRLFPCLMEMSALRQLILTALRYRPRQPVVDYGPKRRLSGRTGRLTAGRFSLPVKGPGEVLRGMKIAGGSANPGNWLDRVKHWNTENSEVRSSVSQEAVSSPGSRGLSLLAYLAIWLVALVLCCQLLCDRGDGKAEDPREEGPKVTSQESRPAIVKTEFEIDIIVKASSLGSYRNRGVSWSPQSRGRSCNPVDQPLDGWILSVFPTGGRAMCRITSSFTRRTINDISWTVEKEARKTERNHHRPLAGI